jgi:hypothetical protein
VAAVSGQECADVLRLIAGSHAWSAGLSAGCLSLRSHHYSAIGLASYVARTQSLGGGEIAEGRAPNLNGWEGTIFKFGGPVAKRPLFAVNVRAGTSSVLAVSLDASKSEFRSLTGEIG